jgi:signal transduction histidine kinase
VGSEGRRRAAWAVWLGTVVVVALAGFVLILSADVARPGATWGFRGFAGMFALAFGTVGLVVATRQPRNPIGWLLLCSGAISAIQAVSDEWATLALIKHHGDEPLGDWGAWIVAWLWVLPVGLSLVFTVLYFPDGRLHSRFERGAAAFGAGAIALAAAVFAFSDGSIQGYPVRNPVGLLPLSYDQISVSLAPFSVAILASIALLLRRAVRSHGDERQQIRWVVSAMCLSAFALVTDFFVEVLDESWLAKADQVFIIITVCLIPVALGIAILKYRLYDIDLVISKALVAAGLTAFVTIVYLAIVVGLGSLPGLAHSSNGFLSVAATAVIAVAFQPVRERLRSVVHRFVHGARASPYEVLADVARLGTAEPELVLGRLAELVSGATRAEQVTVWLRVRDELRPEATVPPLPGLLPVETVDDLEASHVEPVIHEGEVLGAVALVIRRGESLTEADIRLVRDVAAQAGLLLRNLRLTAELLERVLELRESRQRLVAAQDEERRRLERDLHDGAQQQLVAVRVHLGIARSQAMDDHAEATAEQLEGISTSLGEAIETLRELAHGIYPPRLAADGLAPALRSHAAKSVLPIEVEGDIGRYDKETEAAVYFCCTEALQNASKYSSAGVVRITLADADGELVFTVVDDGEGFDTATARRGAAREPRTCSTGSMRSAGASPSRVESERAPRSRVVCRPRISADPRAARW